MTNTTETAETLSVPQEWLDEYHGLDPRSQAAKDTLGALAALGADVTALGAVGENDKEEGLKVPGFSSAEIVKSGANLPTSQFVGRARIIRTDKRDAITTDVVELITDSGIKLRVCDLRGEATAAVRRVGPKNPRDQAKLDKAFWRDMKVYTETGQQRNTVATAAYIGYTKAGGTKLRAYWLSVKDNNNPDQIRTVARIADCGDSTGYEALGIEHDGGGRWVGADVILSVPPEHYMARLVVKSTFADESIEEALDELGSVSPDDFIEGDLETQPPFVLNDKVISKELLDRKFTGRRIGADLAATMWLIGYDPKEVE